MLRMSDSQTGVGQYGQIVGIRLRKRNAYPIELKHLNRLDVAQVAAEIGRGANRRAIRLPPIRRQLVPKLNILRRERLAVVPRHIRTNRELPLREAGIRDPTRRKVRADQVHVLSAPPHEIARAEYRPSHVVQRNAGRPHRIERCRRIPPIRQASARRRALESPHRRPSSRLSPLWACLRRRRCSQQTRGNR